MICVRKGPLHKSKICAAVLFLYSSFPANYPFCFSFPAIHAAIRSTSSFGVLSAYRSPFVSCKEYGHIIIPASFVPQDTKVPPPAKWNVRHSGQKNPFQPAVFLAGTLERIFYEFILWVLIRTVWYTGKLKKENKLWKILEM